MAESGDISAYNRSATDDSDSDTSASSEDDSPVTEAGYATNSYGSRVSEAGGSLPKIYISRVAKAGSSTKNFSSRVAKAGGCTSHTSFFSVFCNRFLVPFLGPKNGPVFSTIQ